MTDPPHVFVPWAPAKSGCDPNRCRGCGDIGRDGYCGLGYCAKAVARAFGGNTKKPYTPPTLRKLGVNDEARIVVTQAELARLLFDTSPHMREQAVRRAEVTCLEVKVQRVLDIMWNDKQFGDVRENCEKTADRVFDRARRK